MLKFKKRSAFMGNRVTIAMMAKIVNSRFLPCFRVSDNKNNERCRNDWLKKSSRKTVETIFFQYFFSLFGS
jgi:hypothetical protein